VPIFRIEQITSCHSETLNGKSREEYNLFTPFREVAAVFDEAKVRAIICL